MCKRLLLTGATGFVGKQILQHLSKVDVEIILIVRKKSEEEALILKSIKNVVSIIKTDDMFKESSDWWASKCKDIDIVINAAWYAEPGSYYTSLNNIDCLRGTLNLAEGCILSDVKKFVGIGTCAEYEVSNKPIPHDGPLKPHTLYAAAKLATYQMLDQIFNYHGISFSWCRLFYLFGEGEDERRLVPYITNKLTNGEIAELSSGSQVRDFIDVSIAGQIIGDLALSEKNGAINVCSGEPKTIRRHAIEIAKELKRQDLLYFGAREDNPLEPKYMVGIPNWDNN
jgi:nucleoside-diphosphate-sugar epimerase